MKEEKQEPSQWEKWTLDMFPEIKGMADEEREHFFIFPHRDIAIAEKGDWPKSLQKLYHLYTRNFSPPPKTLDIGLFSREFVSAKELRARGYIVVYPKGLPPKVEITLAPVRARVSREVKEKVAERVIMDIELGESEE